MFGFPSHCRRPESTFAEVKTVHRDEFSDGRTIMTSKVVRELKPQLASAINDK
jgi:hypothetical protein